MSITYDELERLYVDMEYKFNVYKNRYKRYLDQASLDGHGNLIMEDLSCKDKADYALQSFTEAYELFHEKKKEFEGEGYSG